MRRQLVLRFLILFTVIIAVNGCYTFSSLESARVLDPGHFEVGMTYSDLTYHSESEESDDASTHIGFQFGYGIAKKINLRLRYEMMDLEGFDNDWHSLFISPKFSLEKDRLALSMPLGSTFGEDINSKDYWQVQPGFIATLPIHDHFEFNFAPKALIFFQEDSDVLVALNAGLGFSTDFSLWAIRPEVGFLFDPGEKDYFHSLNIGLSIYK
ncbi:hypothetical protein JXI42_13980 [bacterium]|nr:hypothetical protein [bacterium]